MHSHSGEFCPGHAHDKLEDIVRHAISVGYKTIGLTEHMPRYEARDLYPDEVSPGSSYTGISFRPRNIVAFRFLVLLMAAIR